MHMMSAEKLLKLVGSGTTLVWGGLAVLLAATEVVVDWTTWIELDISIVYGLPLVLAAAARSRKLLWTLALLLVCATFVVYSHQIPAGAFSLDEPFFVNRLLSAVTILFAAGLLHLLTLAVDALDRQRREAEAASARKTRLLASVSHDLRTPLTTISLMAELIRRTAADPQLAVQVPGLAQALQANAVSLDDLVRDILDSSHFDSGQITLRESEFSLNDLIVEECRLMQPLAEAKALWIKEELPQTPILVSADRVKLARVLRNLLNNAIKFTASGGVTMSAALSPDGAAVIRVIDTGAGVEPENLERIFGEFVQLQAAPENEGWGLGLAICKRLTGFMGGEIRVESQPGHGSVFAVHLPATRVITPPESAALVRA
jgi:signal transduction histidine kinase